MHKIFHIIIFSILFISCSNPVISVKNEKVGKLNATCQLVVSSNKKFVLDDNTATRPPYIQILNNSSEKRILTFLNPHNNSIYFFDYENSTYLKKISYEKEGSNAILGMAGYYIKNPDSIYIYNRALIEVVLADSTGHVKERIPLRGKKQDWSNSHPQYILNTVCPFIEISGKLLLTGLSPFCLRSSLIDKFRFTACINLNNNQLEFHHIYPSDLYGVNANWDDPIFMQVYPTLSSSGELVHSFPVSHDLYISKWNSNSATKVYGGSNVAKTINSIDWDWISQATPREKVLINYLYQDLYAAILHDPWRKVYYRFMQQGLPDATANTKIGKKNIIVIIMDEQFKYLGETSIGKAKEWNWTNSFVTKEGLNIEFIDTEDTEEAFLNFKTFRIETI